DFTVGFDLSKAPDRVVERAKLHVLDCFGIALASTTFDFAQRAANAVRSLSGDGPYPAIGFDMALPVRDQALLNGTLIHGLDFDDTHTDGVIHASASALAASLAQGLRYDASGADVLAAFLVGVETSARVAQAAKGGFHSRGYHPTGLVGVFGATLSAGKLANLAAKQLQDAQGIAYSQAAGNLEFLSDGAWTKRMHPGLAASAGITSAAFAKEGFKGPSETYEGRFGLFNTYLGEGHEADLDMCTADLGQIWELENVGFKPYPACHFNHAFADATLALMQQGMTPENVASVTAYIHPTQAAVVCEPLANKQRPQNAYDAQFSIPYIVARTLTGGEFTLDDLDPEAINDGATLAIAANVDWQEDPDTAFPRYYSGKLTARLKDGREIEHREAVNRGSDANPLSADDIETKFWSNAERAVSRKKAEAVFDATMKLDRAEDVWSLARALSFAS
ncbi:MAG: MmgE/PrpD family protein, partial [Alphaproteobacteria bacterium]